MPLVSILTPSYNRARWLPDTLRSVAAQTYPNVEHLVMDGGSTDGTVEILRQVGANVRWWSEPDRGESHALNKALAEAKGEIIGWMNSDDVYADRRAIAAAVETFRRYPDVDVVYGHALLINPENRVLQYLWAPPFVARLMTLHQFFVEPAALIRRSAIPRVFVREDLNYLMYYDLWMRLLGKARFKRIDLVVGADRHHSGRKTLTPGFLKERDAYNRARNIDPDSPARRAAEKAFKTALRLRGTVEMARLPDRIDSAIDFQFDEPAARLQRQILMKRKWMPLD